jgi:ABC-type Fe3+/spermidine/putrescine transport system ATPase subunit
MVMAGLEIRDLYKSFNGQSVLKGISFQQTPGEILAILGPSGSGKTTLLEIIAGLIEPDGGDCLWDGVSLLGIPPHQRSFGLMFQEYVLFPHKNVRDNVAFGLKMAGETPEISNSRVRDTLSLVGLEGFENRDISTLSGGEQQRVALARSLAPEPKLVMLDEPLGALDRTIRERLVGDLRLILKEACQTALYVTHDQEEAFRVSDRVVILGDGKAAQIGTPQEIYYHPASPYVANFLGMDNFLKGDAVRNAQGSLIKTKLGEWQTSMDWEGPGSLLLRPDKIHIRDQSSPDLTCLEGIVHNSRFSGSEMQIELTIEQTIIQFSTSQSEIALPAVGDKLMICFNPEGAVHFYPESKV